MFRFWRRKPREKDRDQEITQPQDKPGFSALEISPSDPLASEHQLITRWISAAFASLDPKYPYFDVELKKLKEGQAILDASPEQARRLVMAGVAQVLHWETDVERIRSHGKNDRERQNPQDIPGWADAYGHSYGSKRQALAVIMTLMRRALPFDKSDLLLLLDWCDHTSKLPSWQGGLSWLVPFCSIARAVERFHQQHGPDEQLKAVVLPLAARLKTSPEKPVMRAAMQLEQLFADRPPPQQEDMKGADARPVQPAPAGNPAVLDQLKRFMGLLDGEAPATMQIGPDQMQLRSDSPLAAEHALLSELFEQSSADALYYSPPFAKLPAWKKIQGASEDAKGRILLAAAERSVNAMLNRIADDQHAIIRARYAASPAVAEICRHPFKLDRAGLFDLLLFLSAWWGRKDSSITDLMPRLMAEVEAQASAAALDEGERYVLSLLRAAMIVAPPMGIADPLTQQLTHLIGDDARLYLVPGEACSDAINYDLTAQSASDREKWAELLRHCASATAARPSDKWLKKASKLIDAAGKEQVHQHLLKWFALVNQRGSSRRLGGHFGDRKFAGEVINEENAVVLRGLLWTATAFKDDPQMPRSVAATALSAYRKLPGIGPRAVKVGNAAIYALSEMASENAVAQLAMLKVRVKFATAQKEIEKAFVAAAEALGMAREEIEELGVPTYGLEEVGVRREEFGEDIAAELRVDGSDVSLRWFNDGKPQKSVPARVKEEFKEELKEIQTAVKDISAMLPAQSERLDSMFLAQKRWPLATWRDRYLDHPLIGTLARRLIWNFTSSAGKPAGIWLDGKIVDVDDQPLALAEDTQVELWHPIGLPMDDVLSWREWIQKHEVRQPFKQAHREVYLLTDAERRTNTYSNRFAAHIIRQHQFNALCAARGWKNKLRLMVDDEYPPASRELPQWGLRAEFWVEGIGDAYNTDTNESGVYLRLSTDQVRFYRMAAAQNRAHAGGGGYTTSAAGPGEGNINEPVALSEIPALVLSEIMRDVDLFVGVASVGNDPAWQDGGPAGRYRTYWQSYSFGDLTETAKTRKAVLERLLPRLKIASRCSVSDKFLVVRGDIRTYKIHLGSGNILMEPNDQYLCIVPDRSSRSSGGDVFLPFEGDSTLSVIISKAFLLADDKKITDPTIVRQIK